eukprot:749247-Rhodomonas_salina.1
MSGCWLRCCAWSFSRRCYPRAHAQYKHAQYQLSVRLRRTHSLGAKHVISLRCTLAEHVGGSRDLALEVTCEPLEHGDGVREGEVR